jgi:hypothetical protein
MTQWTQKRRHEFPRVLTLHATNFCAGVTSRFHEISFRRFFLSVQDARILHILVPFLTINNFPVCKFYWPALGIGSSQQPLPQQPAFASFHHKQNHGPQLSPQSKTPISVNCRGYSLRGEYNVVAVADEQMSWNTFVDGMMELIEEGLHILQRRYNFLFSVYEMQRWAVSK